MQRCKKPSGLGSFALGDELRAVDGSLPLTPTRSLSPSRRTSPPVAIPEHALLRPASCHSVGHERMTPVGTASPSCSNSGRIQGTASFWQSDAVVQTWQEFQALLSSWWTGKSEREVSSSDGCGNFISSNSPVWVCACLLGAGSFSWFFFFIVAVLYSYFYARQSYEEARGKRTHAVIAANVLALSQTQGSEFRDYEVDWLNRAMDEFWPSSLGPWLTDLLRNVLANLIRRHLSMLSANFDSFSLGERAPEIMRVREHIEDSKFTLDLDFAYECAGHARLLLNMRDLTHTSVELSEIRMRGVVRLTFLGFLPVPPYFAQLRISFVGRPDLDFLFSVALLGASTRGLERKLKDVLCKHALEQMVYPHSIPVQIFQEQQLGAELWERMQLRVPPTGVLVVRLLRAADLPAKDKMTGSSDPYVTFRLGRQLHRSTTKKRTLKPDWDSEHGGEEFNFTVWQRSLEVLHVDVHDEEYVRPSEHIGSCEIPLRAAFAATSDASLPAEVTSAWRLYEEAPLNHAGTIELNIEWKPLQRPKWSDPTQDTAPTLRRTHGLYGNLGDGRVQGMLEVDLQKASYPKEAKGHDSFVTIRLIEDVENVCDPIQRSKIAKCSAKKTWKSPTKDSNEPYWRQRVLLDVDDACTAVAHVEVARARRVENVMQTEMYGEFQVPLRAFFELNQSSTKREIESFLPQCVDYRWDGSTIIPTQWSLTQRDYETAIKPADARVFAAFHFQLVRGKSSFDLRSSAS